MSLDVYLTSKSGVSERLHSGIFVRENGSTKEISRAEWDEKYPNKEPFTVNLEDSSYVFSANITHNLNKMAAEATLYFPLWKPKELGIKFARDLVERLDHGLL